MTQPSSVRHKIALRRAFTTKVSWPITRQSKIRDADRLLYIARIFLLLPEGIIVEAIRGYLAVKIPSRCAFTLTRHVTAIT